jgi:Na+-transporting NADH:ubiquinone oxidoreductase subunit C
VANKDTIKKTLLVSLSLCLVCSIIVSSAAVLLRDQQAINKDLDRKKNILLAAGLYDENRTIDEQFKVIKPYVIDLDSGRFSDVSPNNFDQLKLTKDLQHSLELDSDRDIAKISRRENQAVVYVVNVDDKLDKIILPVRGYGLWSTLYGFIALESDFNTVAGLGFYQHGETPGLGGEVDNPRWKSSWIGKSVYLNNEVKLALVKGAVQPNSPNKKYEIDGLSGATLTANGVTNLIKFWLGPDGFKKFIDNYKDENIKI